MLRLLEKAEMLLHLGVTLVKFVESIIYSSISCRSPGHRLISSGS
jgi:hypothetical protein